MRRLGRRGLPPLAAAVVAIVLSGLMVAPAAASVTLSDFRAQSGSDHIRVLWETGTELNNLGFFIWRGASNNRDAASLITPALIPSKAGGQATGASYEHADRGATAGEVYFYWLEAVDTSDGRQFEGPVQGTYGGQTALATQTPGGGTGSLPTSTPQPTGTPAPTRTVAPTATTRSQATVVAPPQPTVSPTTSPVLMPPAESSTAIPLEATDVALEAPYPAPAPVGRVEPSPATESNTSEPPPTWVGAVAEASDDGEEPLRVVGSGAGPETPNQDRPAIEASAPDGVGAGAWIILALAGSLLFAGGGALFYLLRRRAR